MDFKKIKFEKPKRQFIENALNEANIYFNITLKLIFSKLMKFAILKFYFATISKKWFIILKLLDNTKTNLN